MKHHSAMGELMSMRMNTLTMCIWYACWPTQEMMWLRRRRDLV